MGLMGEGDGYIRSTSAQHGESLSGWRKTQMSAALKMSGLEPLQLQAKEGLSLMNGTTQMCAWLSRALDELDHLLLAADIALALSVEALNLLMHRSMHGFMRREINLTNKDVSTSPKFTRWRFDSTSTHRLRQGPDLYSLRCSPLPRTCT